MDPVTIGMGIELIASAAQTLQQYQNGTITLDQAHQQLIAASQSLNDAINQFLAGPKGS
jgi:hypothetical protein